jgi:hypothetical protein
MKRLLCIVSALSLSAAACAEQPGKKKEEDNKDGKVESRPVDSGGGKPSAAKPEVKTDGK